MQNLQLKTFKGGWGCSSVVERLYKKQTNKQTQGPGFGPQLEKRKKKGFRNTIYNPEAFKLIGISGLQEDV